MKLTKLNYLKKRHTMGQSLPQRRDSEEKKLNKEASREKALSDAFYQHLKSMS